MTRHDLTATAAVWNRLVCATASGAGLVLVYRAAFEWYHDRMTGDLALALGAGGAALIFAGVHGSHIHRLRVDAASTLEALHDLLYGKDHRRDREAITILLRSLGSDDADVRATAHSHLRRLTGQEFAADPAVWESWWRAHERTWSRATAGEHGDEHGGEESD